MEGEIDLEAHGAISLRLMDAQTRERLEPGRVRCSLDQDWTRARDDQKADLVDGEADLRFREVPPGSHRVFVDPYDSLRPPAVDVEVRPGETAVVTVEVERGLTVTGRAVDPDGKPLEVYVAFEATYRGVEQYPNTRTDRKGRFTLTGVPPVAGTLSLYDDAVGQRTIEDARIAGDLGDLVVSPRPRLIGRFRDAVARGSSVECGIDGQRSGGMLEVAEDGSFRVDGLDAGTPMTVYLRPEHGAALVLRDIVLQPGEVRDLGEVSFPKGVSLVGRLLDAGGSPVRDALVRVSEWWSASRTRTDAEGRFRLEDLPPGRSTLWIEASPLAVTFSEVDAEVGMSPVEVRLPAPGTLRVRVKRMGGGTLPNAPMVVVRLLDTGEPDEGRRTILRTNSLGVLETALPPGPYAVRPHAAAAVQVVGEAWTPMVVSNRTVDGEIVVR